MLLPAGERDGRNRAGTSESIEGKSLHATTSRLNQTNTSVVRRKMPHGRATARERNRSEAAQRWTVPAQNCVPVLRRWSLAGSHCRYGVLLQANGEQGAPEGARTRDCPY